MPAATSDVISSHNQAIADYRAGDTSSAIEILEWCLQRGNAVSGKALGAIYYQLSEYHKAFDAGRRVIRLLPLDFAYQHEFYQEILGFARATRPAYNEMPMPPQARPISFIVCSHRDEQFAKVRAQIASAMQNLAHEIVRIADAKSMNEGYARGLLISRHEHIVLCHDDVDIFIPDFAQRLASAFGEYPMFGLAGALRMSGPALLYDGHPYLAGRVYHPAGNETEQAGILLCGTANRVAGAHVVDGVFIGAHRNLLEQLGFDLEYSGFHYYDVDLCHRAHLAGVDIGIVTDLGVAHQSSGTYDESWLTAKRLFSSKFPDLQGTPGEHCHWYRIPVLKSDALLSVQQAFNVALHA